ncbi:ABC transporter ATP-binding protein [Acidisoma cellulosilytica]|uniref:ABC transporter ATP-binding protein n=1 Tax=Acidisoma cellulosilyticum TaxID=2802395 RepID=A0A964E6Q6_9PROT|nr:ABC transporter ATP-binding protein [Acidisoma cellulosilyticum]MCB8883712.1 ABC transporter ATP-binding protein [Acidisoma cellulosilyticum]
MSSLAEALLSCRQVSRYFGSLAAVKDVSLDVMPGEVLGIGGPNGAGKSTLFDVITGLVPASAGSISFAGRSISGKGADEICHAGVARTFQLNAAFEHLSVQENIEVAAHFGSTARIFPGFRVAASARAAAAESLETVGLIGKSAQRAGALPVFDRKLLMIAGAIVTKPKILFLDEPVGGLNRDEIDLIQALIERLRTSGMTIVVIEHVMRFLLTLSSRVIIMHHGEIIFEGLPGQVAEDRTVVDIYLGQGAAQRLRAHFSDTQHA